MHLPTTMRALEIHDQHLREAVLPLPILRPGELLIRVAYCGVNRADLLQVAGHYAAPEGASALPGLEVSGHVAALGAGVTGFAVGEDVCALLDGGGYGEYVAVTAAQVLPIPTGLSLAQAASIPEAAATSIMALCAVGQLRAGERVLIHGGTSGLGILMTQIAKQYGAEVYASVGGPEKENLLQQFNILAIDHQAAPVAETLQQMTNNAGVDVIIDTLGGPMVPTHLRLLRPSGRLVSLAMLEGSAVPAGFTMTRLLLNQLSWSGATLRNRSPDQKAALIAQVKADLWPAFARGTLKTLLDRTFPLAEAEKAHQRMQERLHMGKILLEVTLKS